MNKLNRTNLGKTIFFAIGMICIFTVMFFVLNNSKLTASFKAPKIVFREDVHDFGIVPQGPQLQYNFKFTNKGDAVLKIERIQTSCGCTGASVGEKTEFKKNESGEIQVTFNTQGREGKQEKTLIVYSNDPENGEKVLKVICEIDPSLK